MIENKLSKIIEIKGFAGFFYTPFDPDTKDLIAEKSYIIRDAPQNVDSRMDLIEKFYHENPVESFLEEGMIQSADEIDINLSFYEENEEIKKLRMENGGYRDLEEVDIQKGEKVGEIRFTAPGKFLNFTVVKKDKGKTETKRIDKYPYKIKGFDYEKEWYDR